MSEITKEQYKEIVDKGKGYFGPFTYGQHIKSLKPDEFNLENYREITESDNEELREYYKIALPIFLKRMLHQKDTNEEYFSDFDMESVACDALNFASQAYYVRYSELDEYNNNIKDYK